MAEETNLNDDTYASAQQRGAFLDKDLPGGAIP